MAPDMAILPLGDRIAPPTPPREHLWAGGTGGPRMAAQTQYSQKALVLPWHGLGGILFCHILPQSPWDEESKGGNRE